MTDDLATGPEAHAASHAARLRPPSSVRELAARAHLAAASPGRMLGRLALLAVVYTALGYVAWQQATWWVWLPVWAAQSFIFLACGASFHEGVHHNLTGRRGVDRTLAFLAGVLVLFPVAAYRPYHLRHHATTISSDDPSGVIAEPFRSRRHYLLIMVLSGPGGLAQLWSLAARTAFGRGPDYISARQRRQIVVEGAAQLLLYAAVAVAATVTGNWWFVAAVWLIPMLGAVLVGVPFLLTSEHYGASPDQGILASTATVHTNRLLEFVYLNNNHHTAHHLLAGCNPLQLPQITELVEDRIELRYRSYTAFHLGVFKSLPW